MICSKCGCQKSILCDPHQPCSEGVESLTVEQAEFVLWIAINNMAKDSSIALAMSELKAAVASENEVR